HHLRIGTHPLQRIEIGIVPGTQVQTGCFQCYPFLHVASLRGTSAESAYGAVRALPRRSPQCNGISGSDRCPCRWYSTTTTARHCHRGIVSPMEKFGCCAITWSTAV